MHIHARHGFLPRLSYLPRPVRLPPSLPHTCTFKRSFFSLSISLAPKNTARIKRHSSTYPHSISSDISLPSLPAASQAHPKNINSPTHSVAPSAPPMRAYVSMTSDGGATPRKYLGHHRQRAPAAQNASGLPRGRLGCCGAGTAMVRVRSFRGIPTRRMSSSSSRPSWSG